MSAISSVVKSNFNLPTFSLPISKKGAVITALAVWALGSIPTVQAGASAYIACIDVCSRGMSHWSAVIVCPTVCAPFLLAPGG